MSDRHMRAAYEAEGISGHAKLVLIALAFHRNWQTGRCDPSIPTLHRGTGISYRQIQRALSKLQDAGLVSIVGGRGKRNYYELHLDVETNEISNARQTSPDRSSVTQTLLPRHPDAIPTPTRRYPHVRVASEQGKEQGNKQRKEQGSPAPSKPTKGKPKGSNGSSSWQLQVDGVEAALAAGCTETQIREMLPRFKARSYDNEETAWVKWIEVAKKQQRENQAAHPSKQDGDPNWVGQVPRYADGRPIPVLRGDPERAPEPAVEYVKDFNVAAILAGEVAVSANAANP